MEKDLGRNDDATSQGEHRPCATREDRTTQMRKSKHHSFYLSMLMLTMIALIVAWDVTALSLALPVSIRTEAS